MSPLVICPECNGGGGAGYPSDDGSNGQEACPLCGGEGEVRKEATEPKEVAMNVGNKDSEQPLAPRSSPPTKSDIAPADEAREPALSFSEAVKVLGDFGPFELTKDGVIVDTNGMALWQVSVVPPACEVDRALVAVLNAAPASERRLRAQEAGRRQVVKAIGDLADFTAQVARACIEDNVLVMGRAEDPSLVTGEDAPASADVAESVRLRDFMRRILEVVDPKGAAAVLATEALEG